MQSIMRWALSITAFLLFGSLWEQLFPNKRDRSYIRFLWGLVFILLVLKPVAGWFQAEDVLADYVAAFAEVWNADAEAMPAEDEIEARMEQAMLDAYESQVAREVCEQAEAAGYTLTDVRVVCERDAGSAQYGQLLSIEARARTGTDMGGETVEAVQVPQVQIGDSVPQEALR